MALCVDVTGSVLMILTPQPVETGSCAAVLLTGAEAYAAASGSPWRMTAEEGASVGASIAAIWITVGVIKYVSRRL